MVVSMTGFGRAIEESEQHVITVEMKSVNHRFCELNIRTPKQLVKLEDKLKKKMAEYIKRGKADVFITISGEGLVHRSLKVDWQLAEEYFQTLHTLKKKFSLSEDIALRDLLKETEIITLEETEEENKQLEQLVEQAFIKALEDLIAMRMAEGEKLQEDLFSHIGIFRVSLSSLIEHVPAILSQYQERLERKVKELAGDIVDQSRILTEIAIFSDKSDISEEITRLESHLSQFTDTVSQEGPVGRKLDFIIQEMNREVNTIGSKGNDAVVAGYVVEMKTSLEKMREQVQNIE
ncbi:YicC family protein [Bacillus salacetis]|uniref:YicC family protein n=1 Tax=Bacillus salacetis TaxID=2315464 RepID=A0A3A1R2R1_9BACI|nr:YicC/YloC family endoribonuclease [Bacillus salacetis]RIW36354.1 YicC family protein [Bacillus salacetis]